mgnify:CR=1 FL=1
MQQYIKLFEAQQLPEQLTLEPLPYAVDDLEPVMSAATVDYHYNKLSRAYVDRYNSGEGDPQFNWGGAMLHNLWWAQLRPPSGANRPKGAVEEFINRHFDNYPSFQEQFAEAAMGLQGSGWCYLSYSGEIKTLKNQDYNKNILLAVDMWEHSWQYGVEKPDKQYYLKTIWRIINWPVVNQRLV